MAFVPPMLASLADAPLVSPDLVYEPKYDGIRAIVEIVPRAGRAGGAGKAGGATVTMWSRAGNEKTAQFPELRDAFLAWAKKLRDPVTLDGEIVALDPSGDPAGFQYLQGRIHFTGNAAAAGQVRVAFIAFDLLRLGDLDLRPLPFTERRKALERLMSSLPAPPAGPGRPALRISEAVRGDGREMHARAQRLGWEGLIVKRASSTYQSGKRTTDWRKLKLTLEQEFVIGGWTEPRGARSHFGALLLGVYPEGATKRTPLTYVGHTGTGFDQRELDKLIAKLRPLETSTSPFERKIPTNQRPHWTRPELVAQVRFTEWTADGLLRQPVYLGLRDDKKALDVHREKPKTAAALMTASATKTAKRQSKEAEPGSLVNQLQTLEDARKDGYLKLPDGSELAVTNLSKVFWPQLKLTKGDLFRYYARVAPVLLPVLEDRPLVMKRFPNGIGGEPFYQHRVQDAPKAVRIEDVGDAGERRPQIIGGSLLTLMYTTQLAAISQDPWFSRVRTPLHADMVALDLDPMPGISFARVLDVAKWLRDELESIGAIGFPKTSGADGLHIYIPLPPKTPYDTGLLFCQIVATLVAERHPKQATVERMVKKRGDRVYIDTLQNVPGRTLASAYSARASEYAGVSTPLSWDEVDSGVEREDFTITTVPARLEQVGDLWAGMRQSKGVNLERALRRAERMKR